MTDWKRQRRRSINNRELLLAVSDNDFDEVNRLISDYVDVNFKDQNGFTALHFAAEFADSKVVELLLNAGAIKDNKNNNQETPLEVAKRLSKTDIVEILEGSADERIPSLSNEVVEVSAIPQSQQVAVVNANGVALVTNGFHDATRGVSSDPVHDNVYRLKILMLFLYRGIACKYSFRLGIDIEKARTLDGLAFEYTEDDTKVYRLLQAKHRIDKNKKITVDRLLGEINGDYSLIKCFLSYEACKCEILIKDGTIKDVAICTNIDFDHRDLKEAGIELETLEDKDAILDVEIDGKRPTKYKFKASVLSKLTAKLKQYRFGSRDELDDSISDFLRRLVFVVNQPNEQELADIVKKEIGKELEYVTRDDAYDKILVLTLGWIKSKDRASFWSCKEGQDMFDEVKKVIPIRYNVRNPVDPFTGRVEHLDKMHKLLRTGNKSTICVSGFGGTGKSELVKRYISKYSECYDDKVAWINAENYQTLARSFCKLARDKLGISALNADAKEKDMKSLVAETYRYFSKANSLFVFDNAQVYQSYEKFDSGIERFLPSLPHNRKKPHVIITSRNQKWPKSIKVLTLEAFSDEEAATFVRDSLKLTNDEQRDELAELAKQLQRLPLALQQAVAYVSAQNRQLQRGDRECTLADYLERLAESSQELSNSQPSGDRDNEYAKVVESAWNVALDAVRRTNNGRDALSVLRILSYLLPDDVPVEILAAFVNDKDKLDAGVELLERYSLIGVQRGIVRLHGSLRRMLRTNAIESQREDEVLGEILGAIDPAAIDPGNIDHFLSLWTHSQTYTELVARFPQISDRIAKVVFSCGRSRDAHRITSNETTNPAHRRAKHEIEARLKRLDEQTLMAGKLLDRGQGAEALKEFRKIYEAQRSLRGANTRETLSAKRNLAFALRRLEKNDEALKCYREILKDSLAYLGERDPDTLTTRNNIATFLIDDEKYDEALLTFQDIYNVQKLIYNEEDDNILITKNNIANVLCKQKKTEEALKIWQDIYDIQKKRLAKNHPDVLHTRSSIANVLFEQEKYASALNIYGELVQIKMEMFGEGHPEVADIRVDIACTLKMQGRFNDALFILHHLLKEQIGESGLYNPHVPKTLNAMASVLYDQQRYPEAFKTYQDLLSCQITMFGKDDVKTVNTRGYIAGILAKQGKFEQALEYYEEMFRITSGSLGMNHRTTLAAKHEIGVMALCKKEYDKAWDVLSQVLLAQEALLGREHVDYVTTLKNLAIISAHRDRIQTSSVANAKPQGPFAAILNNDIGLLRKLLKDGADVNAQDKRSLTLLHHAVMVNQASIVKLLLANGADVTRVTSKGENPLHVAASKGHLAIVKILLEHASYRELKGFVDARTLNDNTAVHLAVLCGFFEVTMQLFIYGAKHDLKNEHDQLAVDLALDRYLHALLRKVYIHAELAKYGVEEVYSQLQHHTYEEYLALTNARDSNGRTMLMIAVLNKRDKVSKLLVELRFDKTHAIHSMANLHSNLDDLLAHASIAHDASKDENSSLQQVASDASDLVSVFRKYYKGSSDWNIVVLEDMLQLLQSHEDPRSLLELTELVKYVIRKHLLLFTRSIHTVQLYEAAKNNDLPSVEQLMAKNIDVDARDNGGWTPLHFAANLGNERMAELLLARGAEVNCITNMGKFTPLHIAVNKGHVKIVELLLSRKTKSEFIDAKTEATGSTALHIAAKNQQTSSVTKLLSRGASYSVRNKDGQTPADLAQDQQIKDLFRLIDQLFSYAEKGNVQIVQKLKALGPIGIQTVIRVRNDEGFSMTEVAALKNHTQLASQILSMVSLSFNLTDRIPKIISNWKNK